MEAALVAPRFGDGVELALGLLDLGARTVIDLRIIGRVDHVAADIDQLAPDGEVMNGAGVIDGVDDRGRLGRQPRQILRNGHAAEVVVAEKGLERDRRGQLAEADQLGGGLVDAPVQLLREMFGLEEVGNAVEGVVVDQDRAQQRLFRLEIGGRRADQSLGGGDRHQDPVGSFFECGHEKRHSWREGRAAAPNRC